MSDTRRRSRGSSRGADEPLGSRRQSKVKYIYRLLRQGDIGEALTSKTVYVLWPDDSTWYQGQVEQCDVAGGKATIYYKETDETEEADLQELIRDGQIAFKEPRPASHQCKAGEIELGAQYRGRQPGDPDLEDSSAGEGEEGDEEELSGSALPDAGALDDSSDSDVSFSSAELSGHKRKRGRGGRLGEDDSDEEVHLEEFEKREIMRDMSDDEKPLGFRAGELERKHKRQAAAMKRQAPPAAAGESPGTGPPAAKKPATGAGAPRRAAPAPVAAAAAPPAEPAPRRRREAAAGVAAAVQALAAVQAAAAADASSDEEPPSARKQRTPRQRGGGASFAPALHADMDDEDAEAEAFTRQLLAKATGKAVPLPGERSKGAFYGGGGSGGAGHARSGGDAAAGGKHLERRSSSMGQSEEDVRIKVRTGIQQGLELVVAAAKAERSAAKQQDQAKAQPEAKKEEDEAGKGQPDAKQEEGEAGKGQPEAQKEEGEAGQAGSEVKKEGAEAGIAGAEAKKEEEGGGEANKQEEEGSKAVAGEAEEGKQEAKEEAKGEEGHEAGGEQEAEGEKAHGEGHEEARENGGEGAASGRDEDEVEDEGGEGLPDPAEVAQAVEAALYKLYGGVNKDYKLKFQSLWFNLKDPHNPDLRSHVLRGAISPDAFVRMTATELASKELAAYRKQKEEEALKMSVLDAEAAAKFSTAAALDARDKLAIPAAVLADKDLLTVREATPEPAMLDGAAAAADTAGEPGSQAGGGVVSPRGAEHAQQQHHQAPTLLGEQGSGVQLGRVAMDVDEEEGGGGEGYQVTGLAGAELAQAVPGGADKEEYDPETAFADEDGDAKLAPSTAGPAAAAAQPATAGLDWASIRAAADAAAVAEQQAGGAGAGGRAGAEQRQARHKQQHHQPHHHHHQHHRREHTSPLELPSPHEQMAEQPSPADPGSPRSLRHLLLPAADPSCVFGKGVWEGQFLLPGPNHTFNALQLSADALAGSGDVAALLGDREIEVKGRLALQKLDQFLTELRHSRSRTVTLGLLSAAEDCLPEERAALQELIDQYSARGRTGVAAPTRDVEGYILPACGISDRLLSAARDLGPQVAAQVDGVLGAAGGGVGPRQLLLVIIHRKDWRPPYGFVRPIRRPRVHPPPGAQAAAAGGESGPDTSSAPSAPVLPPPPVLAGLPLPPQVNAAPGQQQQQQDGGGAQAVALPAGLDLGAISALAAALGVAPAGAADPAPLQPQSSLQQQQQQQVQGPPAAVDPLSQLLASLPPSGLAPPAPAVLGAAGSGLSQQPAATSALQPHQPGAAAPGSGRQRRSRWEGSEDAPAAGSTGPAALLSSPRQQPSLEPTPQAGQAAGAAAQPPKQRRSRWEGSEDAPAGAGSSGGGADAGAQAPPSPAAVAGAPPLSPGQAALPPPHPQHMQLGGLPPPPALSMQPPPQQQQQPPLMMMHQQQQDHHHQQQGLPYGGAPFGMQPGMPDPRQQQAGGPAAAQQGGMMPQGLPPGQQQMQQMQQGLPPPPMGAAGSFPGGPSMQQQQQYEQPPQQFMGMPGGMGGGGGGFPPPMGPPGGPPPPPPPQYMQYGGAPDQQQYGRGDQQYEQYRRGDQPYGGSGPDQQYGGGGSGPPMFGEGRGRGPPGRSRGGPGGRYGPPRGGGYGRGGYGGGGGYGGRGGGGDRGRGCY